jgi:hypothetical protein
MLLGFPSCLDFLSLVRRVSFRFCRFGFCWSQLARYLRPFCCPVGAGSLRYCGGLWAAQILDRLAGARAVIFPVDVCNKAPVRNLSYNASFCWSQICRPSRIGTKHLPYGARSASNAGIEHFESDIRMLLVTSSSEMSMQGRRRTLTRLYARSSPRYPTARFRSGWRP